MPTPKTGAGDSVSASQSAAPHGSQPTVLVLIVAPGTTCAWTMSMQPLRSRTGCLTGQMLGARRSWLSVFLDASPVTSQRRYAAVNSHRRLENATAMLSSQSRPSELSENHLWVPES